MVAPRQLVTGPTADPSPYGLLSVAEFPPAGDTHWQGGITWQSVCVTGLGGTFFDPCTTPTVTGGGASSDPGSFTPTTYQTLRGATPFTVYAEFDCSPVGNERATEIATAALQTASGWQVERSFWTGFAAGQPVVFPHLAHAGAAINDPANPSVLLNSPPVTGGSATTDIVEALGFLEQYIANCNGGVGVIHVPVVALPTLDAWGLVKVNGQVLRTLNGNKVAVGAGYPGTSPTGAAPAAGTTWIYATGPVFGYAGAVRVTDSKEGLDRAENTLKMNAQRTYVMAWDCCHAGALVKLGVPYSGTDAG